MSLLQSAKKKEQKIVGELEKQGIRVHVAINNVEPKTKAWEHNVGFFEVLPKEKTDKVWAVIRKYYDEWAREVK